MSEPTKRYSAIQKAQREQSDRFHTGLMDAFKAAGVEIPGGPVPEGKSLGSWMVEILGTRVKAQAVTLAQIRALIVKWRAESRGKDGKVYIDFRTCADDVEAALAAAEPAPLKR